MHATPAAAAGVRQLRARMLQALPAVSTAARRCMRRADVRCWPDLQGGWEDDETLEAAARRECEYAVDLDISNFHAHRILRILERESEK